MSLRGWLPVRTLPAAGRQVYDGGGLGKGATVRMYAGSKRIAEGRLERTVPVGFSSFDGLDVGLDRGAPVDFTYKPPFVFTGRLDRLVVELDTAK
jgi:hypothetical protein